MGGWSWMDFASFRMNCIKSDFDVVWPLYVDALTTPRFDEKEFARIKQNAINVLRAWASQPEYAIDQYAKQTAFAGKDYAKSPEGTAATVNGLTVAETKAYYKLLLTKSRMVIVVVADLDKATIEKNIGAMLANIPIGKPFQLKKVSYSPKQNTFVSQKKDLATNYIQVVTGAPLPGTSDYNAFLLSMNIFSDRDFLEVRTNNGLSYAPYTYLDQGLAPSANIFVSTTDPNKYISVLDNLINKIKKEGFTQEELKNKKSTYLTYFYYDQETNNSQAYSLASFEVLQNDWRKALTFNEDVKKVSVADLNNAFNKYINNLTWVYMGDPSKANASLFTGNKPKVKLPPSKVNTNIKN
jgi:zinc protease